MTQASPEQQRQQQVIKKRRLAEQEREQREYEMRAGTRPDPARAWKEHRGTCGRCSTSKPGCDEGRETLRCGNGASAQPLRVRG